MICSQCGSEISETNAFCPSCGCNTGLQQYFDPQNMQNCKGVVPTVQHPSPMNPNMYGYNQDYNSTPQQPNSWNADMNNNSQPQGVNMFPNADIRIAESRSVTSLVVGIIGIFFSSLGAGLICGPIAIRKGKQARAILNENSTNYGVGLAGIITGIIGLVISGIFALIFLFTFMAIGTYIFS